MANSLFPAFVRIDYTSAYGVHSMTVPSVPVQNAGGADDPWYFTLRGAELPVQVQIAVPDFVDVIKIYFPNTVVFQAYTLFTKADADAAPQPRESKTLNIAGTNGGATWSKAVQQTWTWRTDEFGLFKLVFLDVASNNNFNRVAAIVGGTADVDLHAYVTAPETWIAGRDGGRPNTFLQMAATLNEKLRRSYRMN